MTERCDYGSVLNNAPWLSSRNLRAVVSPDLDGLLSYALFSHHLGWRLAGVYTLDALFADARTLKRIRQADTPEGKEGLVFLDHDINDPHIPSIGHHMLHVSLKVPPGNHIQSTTVNPNLVRGITEFRRKYPFATVHFAMGLLGAAGASVKDFSESGIAVLMHVDSSFSNAFNYQANALEWIRWLGGEDDNSPLAPFCKTLLRTNPFRILKILDDLAQEFQKMGLEPRRQATFTDPTDRDQWNKVECFLQWVEQTLGWKALPPSAEERAKWVKVSLREQNFKPTVKNFRKQVIGNHPFAYAIISKSLFKNQGLRCAWLPGLSQ